MGSNLADFAGRTLNLLYNMYMSAVQSFQTDFGICYIRKLLLIFILNFSWSPNYICWLYVCKNGLVTCKNKHENSSCFVSAKNARMTRDSLTICMSHCVIHQKWKSVTMSANRPQITTEIEHLQLRYARCNLKRRCVRFCHIFFSTFRLWIPTRISFEMFDICRPSMNIESDKECNKDFTGNSLHFLRANRVHRYSSNANIYTPIISVLSYYDIESKDTALPRYLIKLWSSSHLSSNRTC